MASHVPITWKSSMHGNYDDEEDDDHHPHQPPMSRLSVCISTSASKHSPCSYNASDAVASDDEVDEVDAMINMSGLSVDDGSDIDADAELSDDGSGKDQESAKAGWSSLPATPQRRRLLGCGGEGEAKEYSSETDVRGPRRRGRRRQRMVRERWLERAWEIRKCRAMDEEMECGDGECLVVAKSKDGGRCLSMDWEEVKACRDLGFQLQNDWTLEIPSRISGSAIDTDSGGNSPIANWRISSPGDDPRDVKARLKVWAQAVALTSASRLNA